MRTVLRDPGRRPAVPPPAALDRVCRRMPDGRCPRPVGLPCLGRDARPLDDAGERAVPDPGLRRRPVPEHAARGDRRDRERPSSGGDADADPPQAGPLQRRARARHEPDDDRRPVRRVTRRRGRADPRQAAARGARADRLRGPPVRPARVVRPEGAARRLADRRAAELRDGRVGRGRAREQAAPAAAGLREGARPADGRQAGHDRPARAAQPSRPREPPAPGCMS